MDGDAPKRFVCSINWHVMQQHARVRALGVGGQHALREEPPPIVPQTLVLAWMQARWSCILSIPGAHCSRTLGYLSWLVGRCFNSRVDRAQEPRPECRGEERGGGEHGGG